MNSGYGVVAGVVPVGVELADGFLDGRVQVGESQG